MLLRSSLLRSFPTAPVSVAAFALLAGCQCGTTRLVSVPDLDAGVPDVSVYDGPCPTGSITGRVCAPDQQSWVGGAAVYVTGTDCNGDLFLVAHPSAADGTFTLDGVPAGERTVQAELGAFTQSLPVTVVAKQSTAIPDNQLCIEQKAAKIAVVTGPGDHIETLLTGLGLQYDTIAGDTTASWTGTDGGAAFLTDLPRMKGYNIIFVDCAAAKKSNTSTIDLGPKATEIASNLNAYVTQGGSLYSSDWGMLFPALAFPGRLDFAHTGTGAIASPFTATELTGYAPQTLTADITDQALAGFVGKASMEVAFPSQTGAQSAHWGLMTGVGSGVDVLIRAPSAFQCAPSDATCKTKGASVPNVPLATRFKLTPGRQRGGLVVYTSFHNIAQPTDDVLKVLKYLVLSL